MEGRVVAALIFEMEGGMVAVLSVKMVLDERFESWSSEMVVAVRLIKGLVDEKVESWSSEMVVAVLLIKAVADEEAVSWSSEAVVVGVFEEVFGRHQGMVGE